MHKRRCVWLGVLLGIGILVGSLVAQAGPPRPILPPPPGQEEQGPAGGVAWRGALPTQAQAVASPQGQDLPTLLDKLPPPTEESKPHPALKEKAALKLQDVSPSQVPDLRPYTPPGWSYPIIPSSLRGTSSVNTLYAGQPTYFDWAVVNDSSAPIATRFYTYLYLDGTRIASWYTDGLPAYWYAYARDWAYTVATPGWHTLRLVADATEAIAEGNEGNNSWEYMFYWQGAVLPNLKPYQPSAWSGAVVPASVTGTTTANTLYAGRPTYIDWAITNNSSIAAGARVYTELYLDGNRLASWYTDSLLPYWQAYVIDWAYTVTTPGWHTLRLVTDATNAVVESDETDNAWEGSFYWQEAGKPNLRPYQPAGWSNPLVLSAVQGTTSNSSLYIGQPIYIDWAVLNDSGAAIATRFYHYLYMDGQQLASWYTDVLNGQWYAMTLDWPYVVQTPGWHKFRLVTDATGVIVESDEGDNAWEADFWFESRQETSVGVEWVNYYYRSGLASLMYNDRNALGFYNELGRIGWTRAFNWGNYSAWEKDFKDRSKGGIDHEIVDAVAFAYFSGHGSRSGFRFDTLHDDYELSYEDALWGDGALNWLAVDSCQLLNDDDGGCILRWGRTFRGLHMILGFATNCYDVPHRGENLARFADGSYWWVGALPIKDAWFQAAAITEDSTTYSAALIALQPPADPSDDRLPGIGAYSADPITPTTFYLWTVQN